MTTPSKGEVFEGRPGNEKAHGDGDDNRILTPRTTANTILRETLTRCRRCVTALQKIVDYSVEEFSSAVKQPVELPGAEQEGVGG